MFLGFRRRSRGVSEGLRRLHVLSIGFPLKGLQRLSGCGTGITGVFQRILGMFNGDSEGFERSQRAFQECFRESQNHLRGFHGHSNRLQEVSRCPLLVLGVFQEVSGAFTL